MDLPSMGTRFGQTSAPPSTAASFSRVRSASARTATSCISSRMNRTRRATGREAKMAEMGKVGRTQSGTRRGTARKATTKRNGRRMGRARTARERTTKDTTTETGGKTRAEKMEERVGGRIGERKVASMARTSRAGAKHRRSGGTAGTSTTGEERMRATTAIMTKSLRWTQQLQKLKAQSKKISRSRCRRGPRMRKRVPRHRTPLDQRPTRPGRRGPALVRHTDRAPNCHHHRPCHHRNLRHSRRHSHQRSHRHSHLHSPQHSLGRRHQHSHLHSHQRQRHLHRKQKNHKRTCIRRPTRLYSPRQCHHPCHQP
mmetsp:Transcript_121743/g.289436  ORF Transcript_121743/g.289436 Transcript_121743/m.289436 type:complete len:313 (-) Transcript_121743:966-1904(-)